jgi:hypothetical protein
MSPGDGVADLHTHTVASDGTSTLTERLAQARECGLEAIAITDHDRIADELSGRYTDHGDLLVVTGVEVRADLDGEKVELLGYFLDPADDSLRETLATVRGYREERNRALADRLAEVAGVDVDYESLASEAGGMLGRPHFARRLVEAGVVESVGAAFREYLGEDGAAFVPMERLDHRRVIDTLHGAGGVVSLAHPGRLRSKAVPEVVAALAEAGLDGVEVYYPYGSDPAVDVAAAAELAEAHDLLKTGGSDCHGPDSGKFRIGEVRVPAAEFDRLLAAAGVA